MDTEITPKDTSVISNNRISKFHNSRNVLLLQKIFLEISYYDQRYVLYTLKDRDHLGFKSIKRLYLEEEDLTEYSFGEKYFYNYDHWKKITECDWFKPIVAEWREELATKLESRYLKKLQEIAELGGKEGTSAIKILLGRARKPKEGAKRGRPVGGYREDDKTSVRSSLGISEQIKKDYLRLVGKADEPTKVAISPSA